MDNLRLGELVLVATSQAAACLGLSVATWGFLVLEDDVVSVDGEVGVGLLAPLIAWLGQELVLVLS